MRTGARSWLIGWLTQVLHTYLDDVIVAVVKWRHSIQRLNRFPDSAPQPSSANLLFRHRFAPAIICHSKSCCRLSAGEGNRRERRSNKSDDRALLRNAVQESIGNLSTSHILTSLITLISVLCYLRPTWILNYFFPAIYQLFRRKWRKLNNYLALPKIDNLLLKTLNKKNEEFSLVSNYDIMFNIDNFKEDAPVVII